LLDHMSWTGTAPEPSARSTSRKTRARLVPASLTGMSPISPPLAEYQPSLALSQADPVSCLGAAVFCELLHPRERDAGDRE